MSLAVSIDGRPVDGAEARIPVTDRGLLLGDGVFETLTAGSRGLVAGPAHVRRLGQGLRRLEIPWPVRPAMLLDELRAAHARVGSERTVVRVAVTRGDGSPLAGPSGPPRRVIWARPVGPGGDAAGLVARTVPWAPGPLADVKCTSYAEVVLLARRARTLGVDELVRVDAAGDVLEAVAASVFAVVGGVVWTPPLDGRILPGITRARVLASARRRGLRVVEARLPAGLLAVADEVFVTSSVRGVAPLVRLDDRPVGDGVPGPLTRAARAWAPT